MRLTTNFFFDFETTSRTLIDPSKVRNTTSIASPPGTSTASPLVVMEEDSSPPPPPPPPSSPPPEQQPTNQELESAMDIEPSSPVLPTLPATNTTTALRNESFLFSTDPLQIDNENFQSTGLTSALNTRKRAFQGHYIPEPHKAPKPAFLFGNTSKDLVLQARDLIVRASAAASTHTEQSSLLDLLEVFRDFTENGRIKTASTILATQVASLESTTRNIAQKAKQLATSASSIQSATTTRPTDTNNQPRPGPRLANGSKQTFASIATQQQTPSTDWQVADYSKAPKAPKATKPKRRQVDNRLVLVKSELFPTSSTEAFSPIQLRNAFNKAFEDKGIVGPVVATVSRSILRNIVVTTTPSYSASFLLEKKAIWEHITPFKSAQLDTPWYKVILHGIPIREFDTTTGMRQVVDEIKTFNKGYAPVGTPYWLTNASRRQYQQAGSVIIAFATEEEANRAIRQRLYVAGISVRVEKLHSTSPTTQCNNCQGYGHLDSYCKRPVVCRLCGDKHNTVIHYCNTCQSKGTSCQHLEPHCNNCLQAHTANSKTCEVYLALKSKQSAATTTSL